MPWALTFHPDGPLVVVTVGEDGTAEGGFVAPSWFMSIRSQRVSQQAIRRADEAWADAGNPACTRHGITVSREGQRIWLDDPSNEIVQTR